MAPSQEVRFRDIHYDTRKQPFCLMPCRADSVRYGSLRVQATDHAGDTPHAIRSFRVPSIWLRPPGGESSMKKPTLPRREDRTLVVDFQNEATYFHSLSQGKAFIDLVVAFLLAMGVQLKHKPQCAGGFALTRHSHYVRIRLGGVSIWRLQCTACKAVFTVLPHFVLRYRKMKPEIAKQVLLATHGGLSLELCAVLLNVSPMAIYRLVCALGHHGLVSVLCRCQLPLPCYLLVDEKHTHCRRSKVYLPTMAQGRLLWHLGYTTAKSAQAFGQSYGLFRKTALHADPAYRVRGILTDGFESTIQSLRTLFPKVPLGNCLLHAMKKVPAKLPAISSALRRQLSRRFAQVFDEVHQRAGQRVFALGQKLRCFTEHVGIVAGQVQRVRLHEWITQKKPGWYAIYANRQMPRTTTWVDQAHNALERKLFMMKGFHHPHGNQQRFLRGLALLYNMVPYQRRAQHAGRCGVEVEGGQLPTHDWFLNLRLVTAGGFQ